MLQSSNSELDDVEEACIVSTGSHHSIAGLVDSVSALFRIPVWSFNGSDWETQSVRTLS